MAKFLGGLFGATAVLGLALASPALAAGKLALVIGNGKYANATELPNPPNDATDMTATLTGMGFEVVSAIDATKAGMDDKIREFAEKSETADVTLFFYAGHGMQVNGVNYLIPIDAKLASQTALDFETVNAENIISYMSSDTRAGLVFLDACRDNPLSRSFQKKSRSANVSSGLASRTTADQNLLIAYATSPGQVAQDGTGRNSPFTAALLRRLPQPGQDVQSLLTDVMGDVQDSTNREQIPWSHSSFTKKVFLTDQQDAKTDTQVAVDPPPPPPVQPQANPHLEEAKVAWDAVKDTDSPSALDIVANNYADTLYGQLAAARAAELRAKAKSEQKKQLALQEPDDPPPAPKPPKVVPRNTGGDLKWVVLLCSDTKDRVTKVRTCMKEARAQGYDARLIDTDKYGGVRPGYYAVVIGVGSRDEAKNLATEARAYFAGANARLLQ
jgi:hypothetical protein